MKYGLIEEDRDSSKEKIARYTGEVSWRYLKPHFQLRTLYWVDPDVELAAVAEAFERDQTARVADWLGRGDLVQVGDLHASQWERDERLFTAAVVSPFVLMQERAARVPES